MYSSKANNSHIFSYNSLKAFPADRRFSIRFLHSNKLHVIAAVREKRLFSCNEHPIQLLNLSATGSLIALDDYQKLAPNRTICVSL